MEYAAGDSNLYRYVGNNAKNAIDPSGLEAPPPRPLRREWSKAAVTSILQLTTLGRETLAKLKKAKKVAVYKVDVIRYWMLLWENNPAPPVETEIIQGKPTSVPVTRRWITVQTSGQAFTENGVRIVLVPRSQSPISAAMTLVH